MRTGKIFAAAATALALVATPAMAASGQSAPGLSMSKALAGAPLRQGTSVRKGEKLRGEPVLLALIAAAVVGIVVATSGSDDASDNASPG